MNTAVDPTDQISRNSQFARRKRIVGFLIFCALGAGCWYVAKIQRLPKANSAVSEDRQKESTYEEKLTVEVVQPRAGGIQRVCLQPGTVEPFESADLYAKVSGFLMEQSVDIGSRVKKGQLLAKISVPEYEKQVTRDIATLNRAKARLRQMEAHLISSEAEVRSSKSMISFAESEVQSKSAYRSYRKKQLDRIKQLSEMKAVDNRLVDENEDQFEAAFAAENSAKIGVSHARLKSEAAEAKIAESKADIEDAKAQIEVAEAELSRSRVMLAYTDIISPYDGVITKRSFNRGDFIRSADAGGERVPLFCVERTDLMRVVVQIPDRDVPFLSCGDEATVELDAFPGIAVRTRVARCAESEDTSTRTMRTEVDIPNTQSRLRRGMYGRVTIILDAGLPNSLTLPSSAIKGKSGSAQAIVHVVRDGVIRELPVIIGSDNGVETEIISGLSANDQVIIRSTGTLNSGMSVNLSTNKPNSSQTH